jgi:hypothetical protein
VLKKNIILKYAKNKNKKLRNDISEKNIWDVSDKEVYDLLTNDIWTTRKSYHLKL